MSDDLLGWFPAVTTDEFELRPYRADDAPAYRDLHSRIEVVRWLDSPPHHLVESEGEAIERITRMAEREAENPLVAYRAIASRETDRMVGGALIAPLHRTDIGCVGEYEIGWHLHPLAVGRGWATQAGRLLAAQAFVAGHRELVVGMYPDNGPSAAVAERLGATPLGVRPDPWYGDTGRHFLLRPEHVGWVETERLVLRLCTRHDLDWLAELFALPEVARWSGEGRPRTREEVRAQLAAQPGRAGPHPATAVFAVCRRGESGAESGRPVGVAMLVPLPRRAGVTHREVEVGWHLFPEAQGQGFATEAAAGLLRRAGAHGLGPVHAVTYPDNERSQAVCRRLAEHGWNVTDLGLRDDWYDRTLRAFRFDQ